MGSESGEGLDEDGGLNGPARRAKAIDKGEEWVQEGGVRLSRVGRKERGQRRQRVLNDVVALLSFSFLP